MFTFGYVLVVLSCYLISSSATLASPSAESKDNRLSSDSLDFKALFNEKENQNTCIGPGSKYRHIRVFHESLTWFDARRACESRGGHLAIIKSYEDDRTVGDILRRENIEHAWVGFHSRTQWVSVQGEHLNSFCYLHWRDNQPHDSDACGSYKYPGLLNHRCNDKLSYLCQGTGWSGSANV